MTAATSKQTPADEDKRRIIENAITAFRPDAFPPETRGKPESCLLTLANAPAVRRLTKHRRLIDGLRRSAADDRVDRDSLDDAARVVLGSTLEPDLPDNTRQRLIEQAKSRLDEVVADEGEPRLQRQHWQHWVRSTDDIYRFTTHEQTLTACNDEQRAWKLTPDGQSVPSRLIVAQFWSNLPAAAFRDFVQPKYWPDYCTFWQSVDPLPPDGHEVPTADGYDWDFEETVSIITDELTVPLHIGFRELPDQSRVWTRFNLVSDPRYYTEDVLVDVDTGIVSAESIPNGPAPTLVKATKYVHWRYDDRPDLTAQACDFGWSEMMVEMAHAAFEGMTSQRLQVPRTRADTATTPAGGAIKQFVEAVTTECQQVIGDNRPNLEQLIGRFTGQSWDSGWINDLLDMGLAAARHYGNIASDVRRFADSLRDAPAEGDAPAASDTPAASDAPAEGNGRG